MNKENGRGNHGERKKERRDDFTALGLHPRITSFLREKGWREATGPQAEAIPHILSGRHVLVIAPTGLGKTEAAILPLFHRILEQKAPPTSIIYITPLRALNRDLLQRLRSLGEYLGITIAVRHGDTTPSERKKQKKKPPDMLITTPETLQVLFTGKHLRRHISNVKWVVVDEIHELASSDRGGQMSVALERLVELAGEFQRIGLSATVGNIEGVAAYLGGKNSEGKKRDVKVIKTFGTKQMRIDIECPPIGEREKKAAEIIRGDEKLASVILRAVELIKKHRSTLFFVNTRDTAEALGGRFALLGYGDMIRVHHGSLSRDMRIEAEEMFKRGEVKCLICTSSLELGIDVGTADLVIHYNSPRSQSRMIQRVGRSGHGVGRVSLGKVLATHPDELAEATAIAIKSVGGDVEELRIRKKPLEVLANQLISYFGAEGKGKSPLEFFFIIKRAYPFWDLTEKEYREVLEFLENNYLIRPKWKEHGRWDEVGIEVGEGQENNTGGSLVNIVPHSVSRRGLKYFYENISMIPDERVFKLVDAATRRVIGHLDEHFFASYVEEGALLIVAGKTWEVVGTGEDEVLVEEAGDIGEVPHWVGEDLPVPYEIAQEVGWYRKKGTLPETPADKQSSGGWIVSEHAIEVFRDHVVEHKKGGFPVPDNETVLVEGKNGDVIVNACFGSRVNETLAKLLGPLLAARFGQSVNVKSDPYRVLFHGPFSLTPEKVRETLLSIKPDVVEDLLRMSLRNTGYMRWQFIHVARKFGVLRRDFDYTRVNMDRVMEEYTDTPVFRAAMEKVVFEKLDVSRTKNVLEKILSGEIKVVVASGFSPIGMAGFERASEVVISREPTAGVLATLKKRLEEEKVSLVCMSCGSTRTMRVRDVPDHGRCLVCGSSLLAPVHPARAKDVVDVVRAMKKGGKKGGKKDEKLSKQQLAEYRRARTAADLYVTHGKTAAMVLRARGVGPDRAARILAFYRNEDELLKDILRAEVEYARTRRFWD